MEDRAAEAARLRALGAGADARVIAMTDGVEELGFAVAALRDGTLVLEKLFAGETDLTAKTPDPGMLFILDTLVRSAVSFGEANGAESVLTAFPDIGGYFAGLGFEIEDGVCCGPVSLIVRYG